MLVIKELLTIPEMVTELEMLKHLYPAFTLEKYTSYLQEMVPHNYKQLAVYENDICVGLTGFWTGFKLWAGKYIEIDNFVVDPNHRSKGIGKMMTDYLHNKAVELGCTMMSLDAYTDNFVAHRFYYNQGFGPKGFHFIKILDETLLS
ncbi:GNAT family N-acetyltransferase [Flavobacterium sp. 7A]|uniref:GNAT family N-acetyltransferase n=1 Tax=Flavobacterium sp. 7A TaxID=2940571 RepID=UPI0022268412|nr:GNAT family N-acetyltransferase [Flavobacterium sp. 7A]MCW2118012.1 ribosomal protein S18 acetylase RimI-like enzyme [Flavobacterium sp. 7A]